MIDAELPLESQGPNYRGEVAQRWRYRDGSGEVGIIASVSQPFCSDCHRARLTTDGRLVTCLFAKGGSDLRLPLREGASDAELREIVQHIWTQRSDRYSEERSQKTVTDAEPEAVDRIEMYQIGG